MSYIEDALGNKSYKSAIEEYLLEEGFKYGTGALGEGYMYYVATGEYVVWFALCEGHLSLYAEYDCGGCVGDADFYFDVNDFDNFLSEYKDAVEWAEDYIK